LITSLKNIIYGYDPAQVIKCIHNSLLPYEYPTLCLKIFVTKKNCLYDNSLSYYLWNYCSSKFWRYGFIM